MKTAKKIVVIAIPHPDEPGLFLHGLRRDNGLFCLPAGHANDGEDMLAAAKRELLEETGIECNDLKHSAQRIYNTPNGDLDVAMFIAGSNVGQPKAYDDPDKEFLSFSYLNPETVKNPHVPHERNILLDYLKQPEEIRKSRPVLSFPKMGIPTRQDQQVRLVDSPKSKELHGRVVAQKLKPDVKGKEVRVFNPATGSSTTEKRDINNQPIRERVSKQVTRKMGSSTLGTVSPTPQGPVGAAVAGKYRSISESRRDEEYLKQLKEYNQKHVPAYNTAVTEWAKKAREATQGKNLSREEIDKILAERPKLPPKPKRPRAVSKPTKKLPKEQQIERGKATESTIQHEAAHMAFDHIRNKYGHTAVAKIHNKLLEQFNPESIKEVRAMVLRRGYKSNSPYLKEEFLTHIRDILVNPASRRDFLANAGPNGPQLLVDLKRGWEKAHKISQMLTPEDIKKSEALEKGLSPEDLHAQGYRFKILPPTKGGRGFAVRVYHGKKAVGHMAFTSNASRPYSDNDNISPEKGYHSVYNANIGEEHRGKGIYQHMIRLGAQHVQSIGGKGLVSQGYQRSADATRAWDKIATHANPYTNNAKVHGKLGPRDADYYLNVSDIKKSEDLEKGAKGDWQKEGYSLKYSPGSAFGRHGMHSVTAHDKDGTEVGSMHAEDLKDGTFQAHMVDVHPDHQRKGLGSAMYDLISHQTGLKPVPDLEAQTKEGAKLWQGMSKIRKNDIPKEYINRAAKSTTLLLPVSIGGRTEVAPGVPLHATIKVFSHGSGETPPLEEIHQRLNKWTEHLKKPIDVSKLQGSYSNLKTREGKDVSAMVIHNPPSHLKQMYEENRDIGTTHPEFKLHISLPPDLAKELKEKNLSPQEAGLHFHPAELRQGPNVLKRFA